MRAAERPEGIWPILYAFFDADGHLDREAMQRQVAACVAGGARGIAALGLATEVSKLSPDERLTVVRWLAEDLDGRLPMAITVFGDTPREQIGFIREVAELGAAWVILQPPPARGAKGRASPAPSEGALEAFFAEVMAQSPLPVGIQNAPQYLGVGLGDEALARLRDAHPETFRMLKQEVSALEVAATAEALGPGVAIFNGRGGLELTDCLRAGCAGLIPAPECFDRQVEVREALRAGDEAGAEAAYARILPLIVFLMQSVDQFLCYGKRLLARRLGLPGVHDRAPAQAPTPLGLASLERYGGWLPPFRI